MYFLATNDVEEISVANNNYNDKSAKITANVGMPRLINLYSKYDVEGTFYFTGTFAEKFPESVQLVKDHGHEVASHGYSHSVDHAFDVLSNKDQYVHLSKSKRVLEGIAGRVQSFRAPALRLGEYTPKILEKLGFKTDSSVASQRFDGPFTFGASNKLKWLTTPRLPYYMKSNNPYKEGNCDVLQIPVSSLIVAYQGTTMRYSPALNSILGNVLYKEARKTGKPLVFLFHPTEMIKEPIPKEYEKRGKTLVSRFFADTLRRKIKLQNMGKRSVKLLDSVLKKAKIEGAEFVSASNFRKLWRK